MCENKQLKYATEVLHLPYFDEVLSTTIICDRCNYKYSDILITNQNKPMEHKFEIDGKDDLFVRVIRSSSATIELPAWGIKIEPKSASEAFISNIEGVLVRVLDVLAQTQKFAETPAKKLRAKKIIDQIEKLRNGDGCTTIILKDPLGNSAILADKTETRELSPEELKKLETGIKIIDISTQEDVFGD